MTDAPRDDGGTGEAPLPVRASMAAETPADVPRPDVADATAAEGADVAPGREPPVKRFRHGEEEWLARIAGQSAYGTGGRGMAYLVAVHFLRAVDDTTPLKEVLIPAARFRGLSEPELQTLLDEAVTIDLEREPSTAGRQARRSLGGRAQGGRS